MRRPRVVLAVVAVLCAGAACATSSPGHGTGAGAPPQTSSPATAPRTPTSRPAASTGAGSAPPSSAAPSSAPPSSAPPSSAPPSSAAPSQPPSSGPPSNSAGAGAGGSTYTGRGGPNTWCGSSQIAVTAAAASGAAGHTGVVLRFLNSSHYQCILYGYPGVDGTNGAGRSIGHAMRTRDGFMGGCRCSDYRGVLVRPGQTASALVEGDIGNGHCNRFKGLLVTPPNTYDSTPVQLAPYSCDFQVHPMVTGTSGEG